AAAATRYISSASPSVSSCHAMSVKRRSGAMSHSTPRGWSPTAARHRCNGSTSTISGMSLSAEVDIEVPFYDVDPMLVVWHGHYVKYCEQARSALLRQIDYDYPAMQASGYLWPVVELHLRYVHSARYGERLRARTASSGRWKRPSR